MEVSAKEFFQGVIAAVVGVVLIGSLITAVSLLVMHGDRAREAYLLECVTSGAGSLPECRLALEK